MLSKKKRISLRRKQYQVVYPEYFDKTFSRKNGRRVALSMADEKTSLKKLILACEIINREFLIQKDKPYPSNWIENRGRILFPIEKQEKESKEELIKKLAATLKKFKKKKKETPDKIGTKIHKKGISRRYKNEGKYKPRRRK